MPIPFGQASRLWASRIISALPSWSCWSCRVVFASCAQRQHATNGGHAHASVRYSDNIGCRRATPCLYALASGVVPACVSAPQCVRTQLAVASGGSASLNRCWVVVRSRVGDGAETRTTCSTGAAGLLLDNNPPKRGA
jgi:hypothetical protein